jgi:hypothetical protein
MKAHPERIAAARTRQVVDTDRDVVLNAFHVYAETEMAP